MGNLDKGPLQTLRKKGRSVIYTNPLITLYLPTIASNFLIWPVVDKSAGGMVVVFKGPAGALTTK